jgi:hypothetical protein
MSQPSSVTIRAGDAIISSFDTMWREANQKYVASTGRTPTELAIMRRIDNVDALMIYVEEQNGRFKIFRQKQAGLRDLAKKFFKPLAVLSKVVKEGMANSPFPPAAVIMGALAFMVQTSSDMSQMYDSVEGLLDHLCSFAMRLEQYLSDEAEAVKPGLQHNIVAALACLLEVLGESEKVLKDGRRKTFGKLLALGEDDKIKPLLIRLERIVGNEQSMVGTLTYKTSLRVEKQANEANHIARQALDSVQEVNSALIDIAQAIEGEISSIPDMWFLL